jgi:hypothetical protein
MKSLKDRLMEAAENKSGLGKNTNYIHPVLCIRLNEDEKALYYIDDKNSLQYILMPLTNVHKSTELAEKIAKELTKNGFDGYKAAEKLDMINDLVELDEQEIEALSIPALQAWFKTNNGAQPWIADAYK